MAGSPLSHGGGVVGPVLDTASHSLWRLGEVICSPLRGSTAVSLSADQTD